MKGIERGYQMNIWVGWVEMLLWRNFNLVMLVTKKDRDDLKIEMS